MTSTYTSVNVHAYDVENVRINVSDERTMKTEFMDKPIPYWTIEVDDVSIHLNDKQMVELITKAERVMYSKTWDELDEKVARLESQIEEMVEENEMREEVAAETSFKGSWTL